MIEYTTPITESLPREIALRQKQYEYLLVSQFIDFAELQA